MLISTILGVVISTIHSHIGFHQPCRHCQEPELRVSVEVKSQGWWEGNYLEEQVGLWVLWGAMPSVGPWRIFLSFQFSKCCRSRHQIPNAVDLDIT